jgi:hypothetical protein
MRLIMKYCEKFGNDPFTLKTIKDVVNINLINDKTELNALVRFLYDHLFNMCIETQSDRKDNQG